MPPHFGLLFCAFPLGKSPMTVYRQSLPRRSLPLAARLGCRPAASAQSGRAPRAQQAYRPDPCGAAVASAAPVCYAMENKSEVFPVMKELIQIDPQLFKVYPHIRLGCLRFTAAVQPPQEGFWRYMDSEVLPAVRQRIEGKEWSDIPGVRGSRAAYKAFGRNPGRYRVSSEALLRRVRRGDELYHINSVVDVNNLLSVESGLSVGSYDASKRRGAVTLRKAGPGEGYNGIGKDFLDLENMLVLADEEGIFGSSMSDSTRAMVTESTREVLAVVYCFEEEIDMPALLARGCEVFQKFSGAQAVEGWIV